MFIEGYGHFQEGHSSKLFVELEKTELEIGFCYRNRYSEELHRLQNGKRVKVCGHISRLCPLVEDVFRLGWLSKSSMPAEAKVSILRAKDFHISPMLVRHIHQDVGHRGSNHVIQTERYWIAGTSVATRCGMCVICFRLNSQPVSQQMADLFYESYSRLRHLLNYVRLFDHFK